MFALGARLAHMPPHICNTPHAPIPARCPILAPSTPTALMRRMRPNLPPSRSSSTLRPNTPHAPYTTVFACRHIRAQHTHTRDMHHRHISRICCPIHTYGSYARMPRAKNTSTLHPSRTPMSFADGDASGNAIRALCVGANPSRAAGH